MANQKEDEANRSLLDYALPSLTRTDPSIRRSTIQANNFEIKPAIIWMIHNTIQFCGLSSEDPKSHIAIFLKICDTFKHNGVIGDVIRLMLFFSLKDKAKSWLNYLLARSITTWNVLTQRFLV